MSSTYSNNLQLSIFGESHGPAIGMVLDGIPSGLPIDMDALQHFLDRRAPGRFEYTSSRRESDKVEFLSGILNNRTTGGPIAAMIRNNNAKPGDYSAYRDVPRPGHADYVAQIKYKGFHDQAGGGHFSGRLTAPVCIAGALCKQWLQAKGVEIGAHIQGIAGIDDAAFNPMDPQICEINCDFPVLNAQRGQKMINAILQAREAGDSVGGIIECAAINLPVGLGDPMFDSIESRIAQLAFGIPAVKGIEFGLGFAAASQNGSQNNDAFIIRNGNVVTETNNCGGILGGITNGRPLLFRVAIKPTPTISLPQKSVNLAKASETTLHCSGRHDPCIVPRAVPVMEAVAAIALYDALLAWRNE